MSHSGAGRSPRPGHRIALLVVVLAALGGAAGPASALPIYAAREGLTCVTCHIDPSGGGMRNPFGFDYMRERHAMTPEFRWEQLPEAQPEVMPGLSLGTDLRAAYYGLNRRGEGSFLDAQSGFIRMQSAVYAAYIPIDAITLYINLDIDQGRFGGPEWFGMLRGDWLGRGGYLRIGSFRLPYGLRMDDHTIWVRRDLGAAGLSGGWSLLGRGGDPRFPDTGVEAGWVRRHWHAQAAVTNGSGGARDAADRNLALTTRVGASVGPVMAGLTAHLDTDGSGSAGTEVRRYGAYGTLRAHDDWVLVGELHLGEDTVLADRSTTRSLLGWAEIDYFLNRAARFRLRYDYLNTDRDRELAAVERFAVEWDWTPYPFFTQRLSYRYISNELGPEMDELLAVWHFHF